MAISTFKRYEKKFRLTEAQYQSIIPVLAQYMSADEYCQDGQEYSIYNIYFDTADSSVIRHSLSKPYYKEKLRLRSYTIPTSHYSKVFLELKKKVGGIVTKRRASLTLGQAYRFLETGTIPAGINYINQQVLNEIAFFLSNHRVQPAAYISYKRTAWFGTYDRDFRITFDRSIISRREDLHLEKGCFGENLLAPGEYLMEVKVAQAIPVWLARLLSDNEIYMTNFSKYGYEYQQKLQKDPLDCHLEHAV